MQLAVIPVGEGATRSTSLGSKGGCKHVSSNSSSSAGICYFQWVEELANAMIVGQKCMRLVAVWHGAPCWQQQQDVHWPQMSRVSYVQKPARSRSTITHIASNTPRTFNLEGLHSWHVVRAILVACGEVSKPQQAVLHWQPFAGHEG